MRIRRDISSVPYRSANDTWDRIVTLITGNGSVDVEQLRAAGPIVASITTDEIVSEAPIVVEGVGPQVRLYCVHGFEATSNGEDVDDLPSNPTAGNWKLHVPCDADNIDWVRKSLAQKAARFKVYDAADGFEKEEEPATAQKSATVVVDWTVKD